MALTDHELDAQIAEWVNRALTQAAKNSVRVPLGETRSQRRIGSGTRIALLAAVVTAIVCTVAIVRSSLRHPTTASSVVATNISTPFTSPARNPGTKGVTFHGLQVVVPTTWALNATQCGFAISDTVIIGGGPVDGCDMDPAPKVSSLQFMPLSFYGKQTPQSVGDWKTISLLGHDALQKDTSPTDKLPLFEKQIVIPDIDTVLTLRAPTDGTNQQILATAQIVPTDDLGCSAQQMAEPKIEPMKTAANPNPILVAGFTKILLCRYGQGAIEQSLNLTAADQMTLANELNNDPSGLSHLDQSFTRTCDDYSNRDTYQIIATYPEQKQLILTARIGTCGSLGVSDGSQNRQMISQVARSLTKLAGSTINWPDAFVPEN